MGSEYRRSYEEQEQELYQSSSETHSYGTRQPHMVKKQEKSPQSGFTHIQVSF